MEDWIIQITLILAALFLPLFPFSVILNFLLGITRAMLVRLVILLAWPQVGLALLFASESTVPEWVIGLAMATSVLYALRALSIRAVNQWTGYLATSWWALLWVIAAHEPDQLMVHWHAFWLSLPLVLLTLLADGLERRFGAAYTDLYGGIAQSMPRFAAILVTVILAVVATPLFPGFVTMLSSMIVAVSTMPSIAMLLLLTWLLWSWAGARLIQGLIVGTPGPEPVEDMSLPMTWMYTVILLILLAAGWYLTGGLL